MRIIAVVLLWLSAWPVLHAQQWKYVDPRIGSVGVGRTFPGPAMPFGLAKPGPDCGVLPNAGWAPMPEPVSGFSQTHVSGTGGGQKYGNILLQPLLTDDFESIPRQDFPQKRVSETIALGYYATTYEDGITTEITTAERCAFYRFHYPKSTFGSMQAGLLVDATHFLGKDSVPDLRERQQFVGGEVEVVSNREVRGYSRIRGGWNNGDAYTVYFCLLADRPFASTPDANGGRCMLLFGDTLIHVQVGLSYVSTLKARRNIETIGFDEQLNHLRQSWERQLEKIRVEGTREQKRMFYTALYHTMLMPIDKTGENPKWTDAPYYDDYYAIWDTYRTSSPLLTLLDPQRETDIVNALLNIYRREGYLPDARSGDCNGRTQGGSNAEVVIADAFAKQLPGIDYELTLQAMLKDGEEDPGADHEKHGRGGLDEYRRIGYIPYGIARAGTRTIEYAYNDFCIAQVARGLGHPDIYDEYMQRSANWRNLWRSDYEWDDVRGYIMPRDANGCWLDSVPWGRSKVFHPLIPYTPVTKVAPWYLPWWDTFFYEALSAEYSLSIPHDVPGLIDACGGKEAFRRRLDLFFERGRYNVGNEPSFLTPCLYHWIGRPDLSTQRIRQIVSEHYSDSPDGLPGNDDGGAMSSWLAFHLLGLYPNAGQDYYLLNLPLVKEYTFTLSNGRTLHVTKQGKGDVFESITFNGQKLPEARITHQKLMEGGEMGYSLTPSPSPKERRSLTPNPSPKERRSLTPNPSPKERRSLTPNPSPKERGVNSSSANKSNHSPLLGRGVGGEALFTLNKQFRTWPLVFGWQGDTLVVGCKEAVYLTPRAVVEQADGFCWSIPADGAVYEAKGTFAFVSQKAVNELTKNGSFVYDGITWRRVGNSSEGGVHVRADIDGTEMWIEQHNGLWLVKEMRHNPLGIDWKIRINN